MSITENREYRGYSIRIEVGMGPVPYRATIRRQGRTNYAPGDVTGMTEDQLLEKVWAWIDRLAD